MLCVAEVRLERSGTAGIPEPACANLMAGSARGHGITRIRRMTGKTCCMRRLTLRDRQRLTLRLVTRSAVRSAMLAVVEPGAKAPQRRERFQAACLRVGMADRADRALLVLKLQRVTSGTRRVVNLSRETDARSVGIASVTREARKP